MSEIPTVEQTVKKVKVEVREMLDTGWKSSQGVAITLPAVTGFGALHDFCDANCLGGMCDEGFPQQFPSNDAWMEHCNQVSDVVDAWIKAGGLL